MTLPMDPNGPSLENIHPPECTCGAAERRSGTSRHMNKEVPRLHHAETNAVDRVINEVKQFHFDLQDGDIPHPTKRLSTINDILAVLKLLAQKV